MPSLELVSIYITCRTTVDTASTRQRRILLGHYLGNEYMSKPSKITFKEKIHQEKILADKMQQY